MKAISLWQPYASAIMLELKGFETRSWDTRVRGRIAIHAAKRKPTGMELELLKHFPSDERILQFGGIVCTADLVCTHRTEKVLPVPLLEQALGDFTGGRFAWKLHDVRRCKFATFVDRQGFFEVPESLLEYM